MHRPLLLVLVVAAAGLAACSERPLRPAPEAERIERPQDALAQNAIRERTLRQGESGRMDY